MVKINITGNKIKVVYGRENAPTVGEIINIDKIDYVVFSAILSDSLDMEREVYTVVVNEKEKS